MAVDTLGCGVYEAYFKTRGGDTLVCRARNLTQLTWGRKLNGFSEAKLTFALNGQDSECCNCVGTINPWEHELAIYRDGQEVWCGPIVNGGIDLEGLTAEYEARDLSAWFDHRWVENFGGDVEFEEADIAVVYRWLVEHAYIKEPWNMEWYVTDTGVPIDRTYTGIESQDRWSGSFPNVAKQLNDLSRSGIDFTVVRRVMLAGNLEQESGTVEATLADHAWAKLPKIKIVGTGMATEVGMGGGGGGSEGWDDDQMWIERPYDEARARFGLLQSFYPAPDLDEEDTTTLPNALTQRAYELRQQKCEPFVYVNGGSLSQQAPITFDQLIPGRVFRIALTQTCRTIEANYRLYGVQVDYGEDGETVTPELTPLGAEAIKA